MLALRLLSELHREFDRRRLLGYKGSVRLRQSHRSMEDIA